jgi:hypothetical protein
VGLERGTLSLVSTTEELLERKSSGSGLESQYYGRKEFAALPLSLYVFFLLVSFSIYKYEMKSSEYLSVCGCEQYPVLRRVITT